MAKAIEIATRMAESAAKDTAQISQSFIPAPQRREGVQTLAVRKGQAAKPDAYASDGELNGS